MGAHQPAAVMAVSRFSAVSSSLTRKRLTVITAVTTNAIRITALNRADPFNLPNCKKHLWSGTYYFFSG
jgi:hypothetical protein